MLRLEFNGWFECRLSTDPDPSDERRGVSGWTFALAGERDLDRIIRTNPAKAVQRFKAPPVGVYVTKVVYNGSIQEKHPLLGALVDLLDDPVFEGRSGLAAEDTEEPVYPFHISIQKDGVLLDREMRDLDSGEWRFKKSEGVIGGPEIIQATGIDDMLSVRAERRKIYEERMKVTTDEIEKLALTKRISDINEITRGIPINGAYVALLYKYVLEGPWFTFEDQNQSLGYTIDGSPWIVRFWTGGWDTDTLCGYMKGVIECPTQASH